MLQFVMEDLKKEVQTISIFTTKTINYVLNLKKYKKVSW